MTKKNTEQKSIADELKNRPRKMNGKPRKIGVMNPYVLVRLISPPEEFKGRGSPQKKLDKIDLHDKKTLNLLNAHFRKNKQITTSLSYRQLFDPKISPLYKRPKGLHKIKVGHGVKNPDYTKSPKYYQWPPGKNPLYVISPRGGKSQVFGDVVQGAATNCYFHAALHSNVWVNWTAFPPTDGKVYFNGSSIAVTPTFLLDDTYNPVCAQFTADNSEYWGCLWEKAYAELKWVAKASSPIQGATGTWHTPPYDPDVTQFSQGDPLQSLSEIANLPFSFTGNPPTAYDNPANYTSCYDTLNNDNCGNVSGNSMMTLNPTVAWTKENGGTYGPSGALISNHAYSILGTFKYGNPLTKYIVLRNPWGKSFSWTLPAYPNLCPGGSYNPGVGQGILLGTSSTRGIFGLKDDAFKTYFAGFGWVQAP